MFSSLEKNISDIKPPNKWEDNDGDIELFYLQDDLQEAEFIADRIKKNIDSGVSASEIAIISRQRLDIYTKKITDVLSSYDIKTRDEAEFQSLLSEEIIILILDTITISLNRSKPKEWQRVEKIWSSINGLHAYKEKNNITSSMNDLGNLPVYILNDLNEVNNHNDLFQLSNKILNFFSLDALQSYFPQYSQRDYLMRLLEDFSVKFWDSYCEVNKTSWNEAIIDFKGDNTISCLTIHKSKGLEYEYVYFIGLEDSAFWGFKDNPEEERNVFFVCISRAKKYLAFSYCNKRELWGSMKSNSSKQINEFHDLLNLYGIANVIKNP